MAAMELTAQQLADFDRDGFLILPEVFSVAEIDVLRAAVPGLMAEVSDDNRTEESGSEIRNIFGLHRRNATFERLTRHPRLLGPARQILGRDFYVQQCKINMKSPFVGAGFAWHVDFATHHRRDGVPEPLALNLHVFLDDVTEFNGPIWFVPGSHRWDVPTERGLDAGDRELWIIPPAAVVRAVDRGGLVSATGGRGTVVIFGDLLLHVSANNIGPRPRRIYSLIVNPISNAPTRDVPAVQHEPDRTPLTPFADDCLLSPRPAIPAPA